jgi:hypothetical protein
MHPNARGIGSGKADLEPFKDVWGVGCDFCELQLAVA